MAKFILYLNLWGTTVKMWESAEGDPVFSSSQIEACQRHFAQVLESEASALEGVELKVLADHAYAMSDDAKALLRYAVRVFQRMFFCDGRYHFWPLRGGVASSSVEAAWLEKAGQKGARLLVSREVALLLEKEFVLRESQTRGIQHCEVNWFEAGARPTADVADEWSVFGERLRGSAYDLFEGDTNYGRQMAASILDLLEWAKDSAKG